MVLRAPLWAVPEGLLSSSVLGAHFDLSYQTPNLIFSMIFRIFKRASHGAKDSETVLYRYRSI